MKTNLFILMSLLLVGFGLNAQTSTTPLSRQNMVKASIHSTPKQFSFNKSDIKKTLSQKTLEGGLQYSVYELNNGRVVKQLVNPDRAQENSISSTESIRSDFNSAAAIASDTTFYERFEGWDGRAWDWIPVGWSDVSKTNSVNSEEDGVNHTWKVEAGYYPYTEAPEGYCMASVNFATDPYTSDKLIEQDEWLITPTVKPEEDDNLYFYLSYNAGWILLNPSTGHFTAENEKIEVYISTDNGGRWTKKWDVSADASSYTEDERWNLLTGNYSPPWKLFKVDLSEYVGKSIKIAFRYWNSGWGESAYIDAVRVSKPTPRASYSRPDGYFYFGFTDDYRFYGDNLNFLLGPAFEPTTWYNNSNFDSQEFVWSFIDPEDVAGADRISITNVYPKITYKYARFVAPSLTAYAANKRYASPAYSWNGGKGVIQTGGQSLTGFAGNYDVLKSYAAYTYSDNAGEYIFGTGSEDFYGDSIRLNGIGNYFRKPLRKYVFNTLQVRAANIKADPDAELTLIIHKVVDGVLRDTIAVSTAYQKDMILQAEDGNGGSYYTIPFTFSKIDDSGREEALAYLEIDDAILVELKGYTDGKFKSFVPFIQYGDHGGNECNSYVFLNQKDKGKTVRRLYSTASILELYSSFLFDMNVSYPFLVAEDNEYKVWGQGGTKNFDIITYWNPDSWKYGTVPDWITLGSVASEVAGLATLPVTVAALPTGVSNRSAEIKVSSIGCNMTLRVTQDESFPAGIASIKTASVQVANQDNHFVLSYPSNIDAVAIYTVSGQQVGAYSLPVTGQFALPAANLPKGVYVLKFTGKTTEIVKVIH